MSESVEMYLVTIYRLSGEKNGQVGTTRLAARLGVSAPSSTEMVKKLAAQGLVERRGRGIALSPAGERVALGVLRKHRLVERLLTDRLGLAWDLAHEQACRIEHVLKEEVADALEEFLGHPATCPHGHPIPDREGRVAFSPSRPLARCGAGEEVQVAHVSEESRDLLAYLAEARLQPGRRVTVEEVAPFHGPLLIGVEGKTLPLSREVAGKVHVR